MTLRPEPEGQHVDVTDNTETGTVIDTSVAAMSRLLRAASGEMAARDIGLALGL